MIRISKKRLLVVILPLAYLMITSYFVQAATITTCTFNKSAYNQGETGYITVTIYNDKDDKIRVTELTATIDYYYTDGNVYLQAFFTDASLPTEIQQGQSEVFYISISLPTNIAPGYTSLSVRAKTELWNSHSETWYSSGYPTYQPTIYIESPYKQQFEDQQTLNDQLQVQKQELQAINTTITNMMYLLCITTMIFAVVTVFLVMLNRKARMITRPAV